MKTIAQIGEPALIRRIIRKIKNAGKFFPPELKVLVPNGDDAFVAKFGSSAALVFSTDTLVEDTHFRAGWNATVIHTPLWTALGYKAMSVNLSDLAAMGKVTPLMALVTLGLYGDISVDIVDNLYTGFLKSCKKFNFSVAGGDIIRSEKSIISVTVVGRLEGLRPVTRIGAQKGELFMASGPLGASSAGLKVLNFKGKKAPKAAAPLVRAHLLPEPKLAESALLAEGHLATSLLDSSDDLLSSIEELSAKNNVGFELELGKVPVHPALARFCQESGQSPYDFILYGGEDYQLLFTIKPSDLNLVKRKLPASYVLGEIKAPSYGVRIYLNGKPFRVQDKRFRHF